MHLPNHRSKYYRVIQSIGGNMNIDPYLVAFFTVCALAIIIIDRIRFKDDYRRRDQEEDDTP